MSHRHIKIAFLLAAAAILFASCAAPPTEEMNEAIEAVTRAENDPNAALYAHDTLLRAQDALRRMQDEADLGNFEDAVFFANEAVLLANLAISEGATAALRAQEDAAALLLTLTAEVEEAEGAVWAAQENGLALDHDALAQDLEAVRLGEQEAQAAMAENRYDDALALGRVARNGVGDINQRLSLAAVSVKK